MTRRVNPFRIKFPLNLILTNRNHLQLAAMRRCACVDVFVELAAIRRQKRVDIGGRQATAARVVALEKHQIVGVWAVPINTQRVTKFVRGSNPIVAIIAGETDSDTGSTYSVACVKNSQRGAAQLVSDAARVTVKIHHHIGLFGPRNDAISGTAIGDWAPFIKTLRD